MTMMMVVLRMMAGRMQAGIFPSAARHVVRHLGTRSRIYLACDRPVEIKGDDDVFNFYNSNRIWYTIIIRCNNLENCNLIFYFVVLLMF